MKPLFINQTKPILESESVASSFKVKADFHVFSDQEWMAIRHRQMEVAPNCIFPARERRSVTHYLTSIGAVLSALVKLPVRL